MPDINPADIAHYSISLRAAALALFAIPERGVGSDTGPSHPTPTRRRHVAKEAS